MNTRVLVDAIVRQTTVLIAQLSTSGGLRAPLAHIANEVFLDLSRELEAQGVSRKVSADMFGMALRAYLGKIRRLNESSTVHGRSLWQAVYEHLKSRGATSRDAILARFSADDEMVVRGILHDLSESGLVFSTGTGGGALYRAATGEELGQLRAQRLENLDDLVWAIVFNEGPLTHETLCRLSRIDAAEFGAVAERLAGSGRMERVVQDGIVMYRAHTFFVPVGASSGWEGAVLDHFHTVVKTICTKLQTEPRATEEDCVGGSTYSFMVWDGHPAEAEVLGSLRRFRAEFQALREKVRTYNETHDSALPRKRVLFYGGQCVTEEEPEA